MASLSRVLNKYMYFWVCMIYNYEKYSGPHNCLTHNPNKQPLENNFFSSTLTLKYGFMCHFMRLKRYFFFFLLSMNEVNIKYWFRVSKNLFFINFLDELGLFIEEKPICTKKKNLSPAVCPKKFGYPLLPFPFNLDTSPFGLVTDFVPNRSYW
jgi:hypothetical protein